MGWSNRFEVAESVPFAVSRIVFVVDSVVDEGRQPHGVDVQPSHGDDQQGFAARIIVAIVQRPRHRPEPVYTAPQQHQQHQQRHQQQYQQLAMLQSAQMQPRHPVIDFILIDSIDSLVGWWVNWTCPVNYLSDGTRPSITTNQTIEVKVKILRFQQFPFKGSRLQLFIFSKVVILIFSFFLSELFCWLDERLLILKDYYYVVSNNYLLHIWLSCLSSLLQTIQSHADDLNAI